MGILTRLFGGGFGFVGAVLCALGGIVLLEGDGGGKNGAIAFGLGLYCLGKAGAVLSATVYSAAKPDVQQVSIYVPPTPRPIPAKATPAGKDDGPYDY